MKKKINIGSNILIIIGIVLIASIGTSIYSLKYIHNIKPKVSNYPVLQTKIDSLSNLNEQILGRIQTSLDSINQFYQSYDIGEYELTYPDSILTWNQLFKLDENGDVDQCHCNAYVCVLKEKTRTLVLFNELSKGNYDFYVNSLNEAPHISPTYGVQTSSYGYRKHPIYKRRIFHRGLDIANDLGTPIYATGDGVVTKCAWDSKYGRYITIKHSQGYETRYAHLNAAKVKLGSIVRSGEVIGEMGRTGVSTGVHLHYEVRKNQRLVNPYSFVNNSYRKIKPKNSII
ncbi:MAG: M23 family metallopeptidase [Candidatus Cloacimonadales bacterium]